MNPKIEPLINDEYAWHPPAERLLAHIQSRRENGTRIVGVYCGYAPMEVIRAHDLVPAILCAFSNTTVKYAEEVLPANLCPLIKSSYGFIVQDACPFYEISDAVIAETTCDGKKKMFELIANRKPMFVMDLPQLPDEPEAVDNWTVMVRKLQKFLERTFGTFADDEKIEAAIRDSNKKSRLMRGIFDYVATKPPVVGWQELYELLFIALSASGDEMERILDGATNRLEARVRSGYSHGKKGAPRVLATGCPVAGDSAKVFKIIEEAGGVLVALDACTGTKPYMTDIEENAADPVRAIAERYLKIPCACMTPNNLRLTELDKLIAKYKPDAVVDVVLHACHSYNIESFKLKEHVVSNHGLQYIKIETDYSQNDYGQISTRVEALLEKSAYSVR